MAAFLGAIRMGVAWLELDVRLSRDRQWLVYHDAAIAGRALSEMTAEEAVAAARKRGLAMPRLREVMQAVREHAPMESGRAGLFVECKDEGTEQPLADLLIAEHFQAHSVVISFHRAFVRNLKNLLPDVRTGVLSNRELSNPVEALRETQAGILLPKHPLVSRELVQKIHGAGYGIVTWTVNREPAMRRLIRLGVDGIITDRPDRLQRVQESFALQC